MWRNHTYWKIIEDSILLFSENKTNIKDYLWKWVIFSPYLSFTLKRDVNDILVVSRTYLPPEVAPLTGGSITSSKAKVMSPAYSAVSIKHRSFRRRSTQSCFPFSAVFPSLSASLTVRFRKRVQEPGKIFQDAEPLLIKIN